jgi:hypothetical protein
MELVYKESPSFRVVQFSRKLTVPQEVIIVPQCIVILKSVFSPSSDSSSYSMYATIVLPLTRSLLLFPDVFFVFVCGCPFACIYFLEIAVFQEAAIFQKKNSFFRNRLIYKI